MRQPPPPRSSPRPPHRLPHRPLLPRLLGWGIAIALLLCAGFYLHLARKRHVLDLMYDLAYGPWVPLELLEQVRRDTDWRTPLMLSAVPVGVLVAGAIWLRWRARRRDPR